jgi:hypothetical protein
MLNLEFATLEATDGNEIAVRFIEPVRQEYRGTVRKPHPEDAPLDETESLKSAIESRVLEDLNNSYFPEGRLVVCRSKDELVAAVERAQKAFEFSRKLVRAGRYYPPGKGTVYAATA